MNKLFMAIGAVAVAAACPAGGEQAESGAYTVEGTWTFTATTVKDKNGNLSRVAGYYTEELVNGVWSNKTWHDGQEYTYEAETANGKTIRLTWGAFPPGLRFIFR